MRRSVVDAVREGQWDFEPAELPARLYDSTVALPGSNEKIAVMAARAQRGLPLWHEEDRIDYEKLLE